MREDLRERLPGVAFRDQRGEGDVGVAGGEPDQIGAGVTAGAEHCGPDLLGCHDEACLICVRSVVSCASARHTGESRFPAIDDFGWIPACRRYDGVAVTPSG